MTLFKSSDEMDFGGRGERPKLKKKENGLKCETSATVKLAENCLD